MDLTLCTFNVENLFNRFDFSVLLDTDGDGHIPALVDFIADFAQGDYSRFNRFRDIVSRSRRSQDLAKREHTAKALAEASADIYLVQEVDDFNALNRFADAFLAAQAHQSFPNRVLHEGNDTRGIDVAAFSTRDLPFYSRSHAWKQPDWTRQSDSGRALLSQYAQANTAADHLIRHDGRIFRRDCLELALPTPAGLVTLFNCHFKSMSGAKSDGGVGLRQLEAITVREIITRNFKDPANALWAICGDLNDSQRHRVVSKQRNRDGSFDERDVAASPSGQRETGLDPLLNDGFGINIADQLPPEERWSHYFAPARTKSQLDYIICSPALADRLSGPPRFIRSGQPTRVPNTQSIERFDGIGKDRPKASDHCPLVARFTL